MSKIDDKILEIDKVICANIRKFDASERGLLSQNLLSQLRNFIDHISLKIYGSGKDIENTYTNIKKAEIFIKTRGNFRFLSKFHKLLQISVSHYTLDAGNSERLMLKYYEYLLQIKLFLKNEYDLDILENLDDFPITVDSALNEYYKKIAEKIDQSDASRIKSTYNDRYYIQKIKPFFIDHKIYYEVTFTTAIDYVSKFDRIIAFTKLNISQNYAVKLSVSNDAIEVMNKKMPIQIIDSWEVSIRPCELNHFSDIFGKHTKIDTGTTEYRELMSLLKTIGLNLVEIIDFSDSYYKHFSNIVTQKAKTRHILDVLDKSRELIKNNAPGNNVIRYLLYRLNNKILKQQYFPGTCNRLSDLNLKYGCIPFDQMPFNTSLINHNPKLCDLFDSIDCAGRIHELFARHITNNTEIKGSLYTSQKDITNFEEIDNLIQMYNSRLYRKHENRKLEIYKNHIYIKGYEEDTFHIIKKLKQLSLKGIKDYSKSFDSWLGLATYVIDCPEKKEKLRLMFEKSEVALVYGSAGTGKSTLIKHISNFLSESKKLYLANTNPAIDNLKRRINVGNSTFMTVTKFLSDKNQLKECDLLVIDECSTLNNSDMLKVLNKASFRLLVLVGDVFQIESIRFGNWFSIARYFIPATSISELTTPYRSKDKKLLALWSKVRNIDQNILEHITKNGYSVALNDSIFGHSELDEIILCLNYDGLYGINNINKFLQGSNKSPSEQWGVQTYKINDPILFNESQRFAPLIYNNLKGKIVGIVNLGDKIQFDIELDIAINEFEAEKYDFKLVDSPENKNSTIRFIVNKPINTDEDDDPFSNAVVPFQVAYAISIHKAQGLEYDSVKVVITDEIEEMVSHNIFYTAITRARKELKIYWTPDTERKILSSLEKKNNGKDVALLKLKFDL